MNPYWSYLLTAVGVFGLWLAGRKDRRGWMVGIGAQGLWIAYATATHQWGFYVSAIAYGWIYIKNARAWKKPEPFVHSQVPIGQVTGYIEDATHFEITGKLYLPNSDYPATTIKHARDFLKEHDPEVLDALFYTRDDSEKEE